MYEDIIQTNINNLIENTFIKENVNKIKLYDLGYINENCNINILSLIIQCNENIDIFNDIQKENINIMTNKYGRRKI